MRESRDAFHLAIPAYDLDAAVSFYVGLLGCKLARRYDDRVTIDFFGDQVVCHLASSPATRPARDALALYPRHFGVTFRESADFDALLVLCAQRDVPTYRGVQWRFEGLVEAHRTVVLVDPSDNLLEFKHYRDPRMMY